MASPSAATSEVELRLLRKSPSVETIRLGPNIADTNANEPLPWPSPRPSKSITTTCIQCLPDLILALFALAYFIYGIVCLQNKGKTLHIKDEWATGSILLRVSEYTPTIYPYLFAATVARCLKNIAKWRSEKGLTVGTMAQLLGSTTISNTLMMPWKFRSANPLILTLFVGWALSPIGSQATQRIISMEPRTRNSSFPIQVLDTNTSWPNELYSADDTRWDTIGSAFTAALAAGNTTWNSSVDSWSNLNVPVIEMIENSSIPDSNGWYRNVDFEKIPHSSLMGVPFTPKTLLHSASFTFEASYFHLVMLNFTSTANSFNFTQGNYVSTADDSQNTSRFNIGAWFDSNNPRNFSTDIDPGKPQTLFMNTTIFPSVGDINTWYWYADLNVSMSYVEVQVARNVSSPTAPWSITGVRRSKNSTSEPYWTPLKKQMVFSHFFSALLGVKSFLPKRVQESVLQKFLANPRDPFGDPAENFYRDITPDSFALNMAQLMNTYWISAVATQSVMGNFNSSRDGNFSTRASNGTYFIPEDYFACHSPWAEILIVCSIFLMEAAVVSAICSAISNGPNILDTVSSLTRDNMIDVPKGGTWMDGDDRTRLLKDVVVVMGDAKPDAEVGYIALSSRGGEGKLDRKRLYE